MLSRRVLCWCLFAAVLYAGPSLCAQEAPGPRASSGELEDSLHAVIPSWFFTQSAAESLERCTMAVERSLFPVVSSSVETLRDQQSFGCQLEALIDPDPFVWSGSRLGTIPLDTVSNLGLGMGGDAGGPVVSSANPDELFRRAVEGVFQANYAELQECYSRYASGEVLLQGLVTFDITLDSMGTPTLVEVPASWLFGEAGESVTACALKRVRTFRFPPPREAGLVMRYPIEFRPMFQ